MSRFFAAGSDTESDLDYSSDSSFSSQQSDSESQRPTFNEFLKGYGSDSDDDDEKKVTAFDSRLLNRLGIRDMKK